jgi:hypothetical protein
LSNHRNGVIFGMRFPFFARNVRRYGADWVKGNSD